MYCNHLCCHSLWYNLRVSSLAVYSTPNLCNTGAPFKIKVSLQAPHLIAAWLLSWVPNQSLHHMTEYTIYCMWTCYMGKSPHSSSINNTNCTKWTKRSKLFKLLLKCLLWRLDTPRAVGFQYHGHCLDQQSEKELFPEAPSTLPGRRGARLEVLSQPAEIQ